MFLYIYNSMQQTVRLANKQRPMDDTLLCVQRIDRLHNAIQCNNITQAKENFQQIVDSNYFHEYSYSLFLEDILSRSTRAHSIAILLELLEYLQVQELFFFMVQKKERYNLGSLLSDLKNEEKLQLLENLQDTQQQNIVLQAIDTPAFLAYRALILIARMCWVYNNSVRVRDAFRGPCDAPCSFQDSILAPMWHSPCEELEELTVAADIEKPLTLQKIYSDIAANNHP